MKYYNMYIACKDLVGAEAKVLKNQNFDLNFCSPVTINGYKINAHWETKPP